ncbi:hypothetical protein F909_04060 [Acinetobacter sp. ANC 3929]|nr:hypothetical protein F909_04060 [Acinetobacter sp. ANC 3929]
MGSMKELTLGLSILLNLAVGLLLIVVAGVW